MNIDHLRFVLEISKAGSISQAAENLYIGQPNLSKAIKELEHTLNFTIFHRTSKGATLTEKGRDFIKYAQNIMLQYEEIQALGDEYNENKQSLSLSIPRASYIVDAFTSFLSELDVQKSLNAELFETNSMQTINHICSQRSGIGIIRCKTEYQNYYTSFLKEQHLSWNQLIEFEYLVLLSRTHPLCGKELIEEKDLYPYTEITHGDSALPYLTGQAAEEERGFTPGNKKIQIYERGSQFDILARVPGTYMWVSPMPDDLLQRNGLIQKRCSHSPSFSDLLIYSNSHKIHVFEKSFLMHLDKSIQKIFPYNTLYHPAAAERIF